MAGNIFSALTASVDCVVKYIKDFKNGKKGCVFCFLIFPLPPDLVLPEVSSSYKGVFLSQFRQVLTHSLQ